MEREREKRGERESIGRGRGWIQMTDRVKSEREDERERRGRPDRHGEGRIAKVKCRSCNIKI